MAKKTKKAFDIRSAIYDRSNEAETGIARGFAVQEIGPNGKPRNLLVIKVSGMEAAKERDGHNLRTHILDNNEVVPGTAPAEELIKGKLKALSAKLSYQPDEIVGILDAYLGTEVEEEEDAATERANEGAEATVNGQPVVD